MHRSRVLSGLILFPLALAVILWLPPFLFAVTVGCLALLAAGELFALAAARGLRPVWPTGLVAAGLAAAAPALGGRGVALGALAVAGAGTLAWIALAGGDPAAGVARAGVTALGAAYAGGLLAFAVLLREGPAGPRRLLAAGCIVWAGDIAAYYGGRAFGVRKLAPTVSPAKTVEGALAGLAASAAVAAAGSAGLWAGPTLPWALVGGLLGIAGQVGDLAESLLKRSLGVKDSGHLIPGHGGLLDRLDSLLFAVPALYGLTCLGLI
jgi:phosphatidate cytidylyltransferase